jgi:hypothetical protein
MDEESPTLEYLRIAPTSTRDPDIGLILPETFQARRRHAHTCRSPLVRIFPPKRLERLSLMPCLETLMIDFYPSVPNRDTQSTSDYLEALFPSIATPAFETLDISFFQPAHIFPFHISGSFNQG